MTRGEVVAEALSWVGTRYHHCADVKGHGVDCAMILVRIYCDLGIAPAFDPRPYAPQWYLHRGETIYLNWIAKYAHQVDEPQPGDISLFNFGRHAAHGAVVIDELRMVHAYQPAKAVEVTERRSLESQLHSHWSPFK
jgi:cell wall-associated NlpC family hydrolase